MGNGRTRVCHLLTQDLSATGVSIVYARPLTEGQRIDLELPHGTRKVIVRRITNLSDGYYLSGCEFESATPQ
jgi:PilZ domain